MIISFISSVHIKRSIGNIVSSLTCAKDVKSAVDGLQPLVDVRLVAAVYAVHALQVSQFNGCALGELSIMKSRVYKCIIILYYIVKSKFIESIYTEQQPSIF